MMAARLHLPQVTLCAVSSVNVAATIAALETSLAQVDVAAALQLQGMTAHYLTHSLFPLAPGNSCLIHAGAGGIPVAPRRF